MPIFEYRCGECDHRFEELVRGETTVRCPACGSEKAEKQLSLFAAGSGRDTASPPPCFSGERGCALGKCGSGRCGVE
jgi:putative FmdB family regulatory protein